MPTSAEQKADGWLSVTEVLDHFIAKGLLDWFLKTGKKEAKRLSTVALKIGSRVDELIQADVTKGSYKLSSKDGIEVRNCMEAWEAFKRDYAPTITGVQIEVKSDGDKLIGHTDLVMNYRIVDVKCASSIKPNYWLQVSKYLHMYRDPETGEIDTEIDGIAILRLDKNLGTYQFMTHEQAEINIENCVKVFDGLLMAYRYYQPTAEKEE